MEESIGRNFSENKRTTFDEEIRSGRRLLLFRSDLEEGREVTIEYVLERGTIISVVGEGRDFSTDCSGCGRF